ncbi:MAG: N-acetylmuramoyl-L-alanine amidase [Patescibacteria group bacterium]
MRRKLFVDLGHSAKWPGAVGIKKETDWNRAIYRQLEALLRGVCIKKGWELIAIPDKFFIELSANNNLVQRIRWINARSKPSDLLLSLHGNAATNPKARGVTTCFMGGSEAARLESIELSKAYSLTTGVPVWGGGAFDDRNNRYGRIGMVRDTTPFALLIEAGFVTNQEDMAVDSRKAAEGIAAYYQNSKF